MKTRELIKLLNEEDPSGDVEVCVGGKDILDVALRPAYWDGNLEVLERDESNPYYNVTGAKITRKGEKLAILEHTVDDAIFENPDLPVKLEGFSEDQESTIRSNLDQKRKEAQEIKQSVAKMGKIN